MTFDTLAIQNTKKKKLTVLHLTTSFPTCESDSSGVFILNLLRALEKRGLSNYVLTPASGVALSSGKVFRFRYAPRGLERIANLPGGIPAALKKNPALALLLPSFLGSMVLHLVVLAKYFDIIHAHWSICGCVACLTKSAHKKPVLTTVRGSDIKLSNAFFPYKAIHEISVKGSLFTVGVSRKIVDDLTSSRRAISGRFVFIPNGVDESFHSVTRSLDFRASPLRLLFLGSLVKGKGVNILIQALSHVENGWMLSIAGTGPEMENLKSLSRQLTFDRKVNFLGMVPPAQVPSLMSDHHVLVLPSYSEGRPNVVLEAMASGLPVIGSDIDGIRELVLDGRTGYLVPPGNPEALAQKIALLADRPSSCIEMGRRARRWVTREKLTWDETAKSYIDLYRRAKKSQENKR